MPRKSRQLRLQQAQELSALYEDAGLAGNKQHRFITDMVHRLQRRDITGGQKKFLDSLIEQGKPEVKNASRVAEIQAAMEIDGMQHRREPLAGFARSLAGGWKLSEKQEKFLSIILQEAEKIKVNGRYRPTEEQVGDLRVAIAKVKGSGAWYLSHRPGTAKAYDTVKRWMDWLDAEQVNEAARDAGVDVPVLPQPHIDEWNVNKMLTAAKTVLRELKKPKYVEGSLVYYYDQKTKREVAALVAGAPIFEKGQVRYPIIVNGEYITSSGLTKRRTRRAG